MTAHPISLENLLRWRGREPLGCGFQNFLDVSGHVADRANQFSEELVARGKTAPASLWGMKQPEGAS